MAEYKDWSQQTRSVTMTNEEWNALYCYLIGTTRHIEGEREAWEELAKEKKEDGSPKFPNAAGNAEYYRQTKVRMDGWLAKIDGKEA